MVLSIASDSKKKTLRIIRYFGHILTHVVLKADLFNFDVRILTEMQIRCRGSSIAIHLILFGPTTGTQDVPGMQLWCIFLQNLGRTFPRLNFLKFHFKGTDEIRSIRQITQHFPRLTTLMITVDDMESLQRLILISRRLRELHLSFRGQSLTPNFGNQLNSCLPDLFELTIDSFKRIEDFILRHYIIHDHYYSNIKSTSYVQ